MEKKIEHEPRIEDVDEIDDEAKRDHWGSYECSACFRSRGGTGVVFDVRVTGWAPGTVSCPICGQDCVLHSQWEPSEGGYGSRSEGNS